MAAKRIPAIEMDLSTVTGLLEHTLHRAKYYNEMPTRESFIDLLDGWITLLKEIAESSEGYECSECQTLQDEVDDLKDKIQSIKFLLNEVTT